jgi:hypothetical protein
MLGNGIVPKIATFATLNSFNGTKIKISERRRAPESQAECDKP